MSMSFNPIIIENENAYLTDVKSDPIFLWNIKTREQQAQKLLSSLDVNTENIICLGCEFLPYLRQYPFLKNIIIVEKSGPYLTAYCQTRDINLSDYQNLKICTTTLGIESPSLSESYFKDIFYTSELGELLLQLYHALGANYLPYQLLYFTDNASDANLGKTLRSGISLTITAWEIHLKNKIKYATSTTKPSRSNNIIWIRSASLEELSIFNTDLSSYQISCLGPLTDLPSILNSNVDQADLICRYYVELNQKLWDLIYLNHPSFIIFHNFAPFTTLESYIFLFKQIETLCIPIKSFSYDFLNIACSGFRGGVSYLLYSKYGIPTNTRLFHFDPVSIKLFKDHDTPTHFYYLNLTERVKSIKPVITTYQELTLDIAIVHLPRIYYQTESIEILREHYEYLQSILNDETGNIIFKYWYQFRYFINHNQGQQNIYFQNWLNIIDWFFYSIIRIYRVINVYQQFKTQFNIKIFGNGWDQWLPTEACGGKLSHQEVNQAYQKALLSLDLTFSNSKIAPHMNVLECLSAGGLPLIMDVTYQEDKNDFQCQVQSMHPDNFIFFHSYQEIGEWVTKLKSNISLRTNLIQSMQQKIIKNFNQSNFSQKLPELEKIILPFLAKDPKMQLNTLSSNHLNKIFQNSLGYFYMLLGFPLLALTTWTQNIQQGEKHPLVLYRTAKTAKRLGQMDLFNIMYDQLKNLKQYENLLNDLNNI